MSIFMLDTNALNYIGNSTIFFEKVISSVKSGKITLYITHIQHDEINAIPDSKADLMSKLQYFVKDCCKRVPTTGAICGISACGECGVSNGIDIDAIRKNSPKRIYDALIAATANSGSDYFVTDDGRLRKRVLKELPSLKLLTHTEFHKLILK
jgi:rRNA-processing protein FCF1